MKNQEYYASYAIEDYRLRSKILVLNENSFPGVRIPHDLPLTQRYRLPKPTDFVVTEKNGLIRVSGQKGFSSLASISYGREFLSDVLANFIDCQSDLDLLIPKKADDSITMGNHSLISHLIKGSARAFIGRYNVTSLRSVIKGNTIKKEII